MSNETLYPGRRRIALSAVLALLCTLLVTVSGIAPALAGSKIINFQVDESATLEGSTPNILIVLTHDGQPATPIVVTITATPGTASTDDYTLSPNTVTFPSDAPSGMALPVSLAFTPDTLPEKDETLTLTINSVAGGSIGLTDTHVVTIVNDDDKAGITVDELDGVFVLEGGATDTFSIVLDSKPKAEVTITLSAASRQLAVSPIEVTFDSTNWDVPRHVTVVAVEDGMDEADPHTSPISFMVSTVDLNYSALTVPQVIVAIGDADSLLVTIDGPAVGVPGVPASFAATVNVGATGTITYDWTAFYLGNNVASGSQAVFQFTPSEGGPYVVQVVVGDSEGQNPAEFIPFRALSDISGSVFADDIVWLAQNEITKGCNPPVNDQFCPTDVVTRGQMAAFLVRFLGLTDDGGGNTFTDDDGSIFETEIAKLAAAGITKGCNPPDNTNFCPDDPVTREQMAAFMVRALRLTDESGNAFTDDDGSIFETDIAKLATAGITKGCNPPDNTNFCPDDPVTREQMAAFIRRADAINQ